MYVHLDGVLSAPVTAFTSKGEIDEERTAEHIDYLLANGISALILLAVTGEFASLSVAERKRIIDFSVKHVVGRVPVIAGISDSNLNAVLELGSYAASAGAQAVFLTPPYVYGYTEPEVIRFFETVAHEIDLHIQLYNAVGIGRNLTPSMVAELAQIDNVLSIKEGNPGQLSDVIALVGHKLSVFCARDSYLLETLALGGSGVTSVTGIVTPALITEIHRAWTSGELERARTLQRRILKLTNLLVKRSYPAGVKAGLELIGLPVGAPRAPLLPYTEQERAALKEELDSLGIPHFTTSLLD